MRNYSCTNSNTFVTYNINEGEYIDDGYSKSAEIQSALCRALEVRPEYVERFFRKNETVLLNCADLDTARDLCIKHPEDYCRLTPAECDVVITFFLHLVEVNRIIDKTKLSGARSFSFVYINVNTGASLVWTHAVL